MFKDIENLFVCFSAFYTKLLLIKNNESFGVMLRLQLKNSREVRQNNQTQASQ